MENHKIRVAITQGDTNGAGLELIMKAFAEPEMLELCTPIIYSSQKAVAAHAKALGLNTAFHTIGQCQDARDGKLNLVDCYKDDVQIEFGSATPASSLTALKALEQALTDYREGHFDTLVCAPMADNLVDAGGYKFANQTAYIETVLGTEHKATAIYLNKMMRMAMVTGNSGLAEVSKAITLEAVKEKLQTMHTMLKRDFRISNPRIAVLALNPSAAGSEEENILLPAINEAKEQHQQVFGPYPAETFFGNRHFEAFDAILAMYYDQAMLPIHMITDSNCVRVLAGLPITCTMPDDTMMDIAGKNQADPAVLRNAIYAAIDICRHRREHDAPKGNPLPKLYHERPDNGEKLRFSIPKKKEEAK